MKEPDPQVSRRELLGVATAAGAVSLFPHLQAADAADETVEIIDTNISLFQWPCRRLPYDNTVELVNKLKSLGITEAWAGSFEGLLHRDLVGVNRRLDDECGKHPMLVPVGSVNPNLPDWEHDLETCLRELRMPGIRLHPNYHGYTLDDPRFVELLELTTKLKGFVQLAVAMEDERTQHPLLRVPEVDLSPLPGILSRMGGVRLQLLNYRPRTAMLRQLAPLRGLYFDVARVDGTNGISELAEHVTIERLLTGSHAPFLIPEAALIRLHESRTLSRDQLRKIMDGNAEQFRSRLSP